MVCVYIFYNIFVQIYDYFLLSYFKNVAYKKIAFDYWRRFYMEAARQAGKQLVGLAPNRITESVFNVWTL